MIFHFKIQVYLSKKNYCILDLFIADTIDS